MPRSSSAADRFIERWTRLVGRRLKRRPLLGPLLAATVFGFAAIAVADGDDEFLLVNGIALVGLVALWCGRLRRGAIARIVLTGLAVVAVSATLAVVKSGRPDFAEVTTVFAAYGVAIAVVGVLTRFAGRLIRRKMGLEAGDVRFTLGGVLTALTFTAIASTLVRFAESPGGNVWEMMLGFSCFAMIPIAGDQVAKRIANPFAAAAGMGVIALVAATCFSAAADAPNDWFGYTLWQGVVVGVWLLGLRVERRRRSRPLRLYPPSIPPPAPDGDWIHDEPPARVAQRLDTST
ncbi:MAG: hypothetical protein AAGJ46_07830 [Planctomycetota bacterium]